MIIHLLERHCSLNIESTRKSLLLYFDSKNKKKRMEKKTFTNCFVLDVETVCRGIYRPFSSLKKVCVYCLFKQWQQHNKKTLPPPLFVPKSICTFLAFNKILLIFLESSVTNHLLPSAAATAAATTTATKQQVATWCVCMTDINDPLSIFQEQENHLVNEF